MPIFFGCSGNNNQKVIIMFESPPSLKQEQELVLNLNSNISKRNLSKFLNNQNWIDAFLIKRHVFKPLEIFIKTKEPKYIWKDKFYLDSSLSKFIYSGEHPHLVHLDMPIEFVDQWSQVEDQFHSIVQLYNLKIFSVSYTESEGWYFNTETNLRINLGADLSTSMLEKLSLTLKYIFEKNLTPSIIDLRYKDGAALNYGK
jgi:cell division septal protein FtsQ